MNPINIKNSNHKFGPPDDWDENVNGKCETLDVRLAKVDNVTPVIESAWKPSEEELATLNSGGSVILRIYGNGMPPVSVYVEE